MNIKKIFNAIALIFLSTASFSVEAMEGGSQKYSAINFNPEIFSLSKKKENAFDAPSATYVLGSEEIRRSGSTSIPEALRLVPGLQVARVAGNQWAISARGFNDQYSNKLLVMIDGRIIYTPLFSGVLWDSQDYVIEDIDRIEVVRGPGGTIWGSNAVNGVINIITKSAVQTQGAYVSQIVGDQDKSITEVRYGGKTKSNDNYRIYAKKSLRDSLDRYDNRQSNHDGNSQDRAGFRYDMSSIKDNTILVHGDIYSGTAQRYFGNPPISNNSVNDKDSRGGDIVLNWDKKLSKKSHFTLNTYFDYDKMDTPILERSAQTYDIDFQHFYNFSKENQFTWGLGYRRFDDHIKESQSESPIGDITLLDYNPNSLNSYVYSGFIQDKIGLISDELYLTIGSKFLNNNFTGFEYQPNARLAYYPSRNQTLWASISRAVRTPTRGEDGLNLFQGVQQGNADYKSENVMAYELGYRIKPNHKISIDATTYYNDYSNLRTFEYTGSTNNLGLRKYKVDNNGYGESYGFELSTKWQATNKWKLEFDYDYLKMTLHQKEGSTDDTSEFSLQLAEGRSPQNQFKIKSFYNLTPKIEFDNILYYVDKLKTGTATSTSGPGHIPSYFRFDTRLGYLPTKNLDLSVGIQNLFDQRHSEFKNALFNRQTVVGRTAYVKMVWQY
jgi:iron complex outermembrane receptor protein